MRNNNIVGRWTKNGKVAAVLSHILSIFILTKSPYCWYVALSKQLCYKIAAIVGLPTTTEDGSGLTPKFAEEDSSVTSFRGTLILVSSFLAGTILLVGVLLFSVSVGTMV